MNASEHIDGKEVAMSRRDPARPDADADDRDRAGETQKQTPRA